MALNTALTTVAELIATSLNGGAGSARQNLGGGGTAFGWTSGMVPTVANYATPATASGMSFPVTRVTESGTPAAKVAAGAAKPDAATVTEADESLSKFAGIGKARLENFLNADSLAGAIARVLGASSLKAFELDAIGKLTAAMGTPVTAADWVGAAAAAQAQVVGRGGTPTVFVISHLDYAAFMLDVLATNAFSQSPESPIGAILGSPIHVSPSAPAGTAFVFDSAGVVCVEHEASPLVIVDTVTLASTNEIRIVGDLVAGTFVGDASLVAGITAPV